MSSDALWIACLILASLLPCAVVVYQRSLDLRVRGVRFQFSALLCLVLLLGVGVEVWMVSRCLSRGLSDERLLALLLWPTLVAVVTCLEVPQDPDPPLAASFTEFKDQGLKGPKGPKGPKFPLLLP